jgi:oxygen-independent coproporphyrinogen-3 oxidase
MLVPFRQAAEEYTFEVNPRSATTPKIRLLADAGVSRVSFGAQTFVSRHLQTLGRGHGPEDIVRVYTLLRERIPSISFDLIFALPGESLAEWARDLELATRLEPDHLSVYSLTYEAGTPLAERAARGEIEPVHEDLEREMYLLAMTHLAAAGYEHYEVSNFSRPGHRSLHNQAYWEQEDYIGVGPGACSTLGSVRHVNLPDLDGYVRGLVDRGAPPRTVEQLSEETLLREFLLLRLRTGSGLSLEAFRRRAGKDLADYSQGSVDEMIAQGFLSREGDCLRLTTAGFCVADRVIVELMA